MIREGLQVREGETSVFVCVCIDLEWGRWGDLNKIALALKACCRGEGR